MIKTLKNSSNSRCPKKRGKCRALPESYKSFELLLQDFRAIVTELSDDCPKPFGCPSQVIRSAHPVAYAYTYGRICLFNRAHMPIQ